MLVFLIKPLSAEKLFGGNLRRSQRDHVWWRCGRIFFPILVPCQDLALICFTHENTSCWTGFNSDLLLKLISGNHVHLQFQRKLLQNVRDALVCLPLALIVDAFPQNQFLSLVFLRYHKGHNAVPRAAACCVVMICRWWRILKCYRHPSVQSHTMIFLMSTDHILPHGPFTSLDGWVVLTVICKLVNIDII